MGTIQTPKALLILALGASLLARKQERVLTAQQKSSERKSRRRMLTQSLQAESNKKLVLKVVPHAIPFIVTDETRKHLYNDRFPVTIQSFSLDSLMHQGRGVREAIKDFRLERSSAIRVPGVIRRYNTLF